jgi:hypothetical protein
MQRRSESFVDVFQVGGGGVEGEGEGLLQINDLGNNIGAH